MFWLLSFDKLSEVKAALECCNCHWLEMLDAAFLLICALKIHYAYLH
jgi:hypothetical protein